MSPSSQRLHRRDESRTKDFAPSPGPSSARRARTTTKPAPPKLSTPFWGGPARGPRSADRRRPEQFHGLGRVQLSSGTSSRWPARPGVSATCARHGHVMLRHGGKRYAADLTEVALAQRAQVIRASAHRPSPPGRPMVRTGEPGCCGAVRSVRSASVDRASHRSASRLQHRSSVSCVTTVA